MPLSVSDFMRDRKKAYQHWRNRRVRKAGELEDYANKARAKGTEESSKAYLSQLREAKKEYENSSLAESFSPPQPEQSRRGKKTQKI